MTLGLDLQGGSHILLAIDRNDLIDERLTAARDEIRTALRDAKIGYTGLSGSGRVVQVRIREANDVDGAKTALEALTQPLSTGVFGGGTIAEFSLDEPEPGLLRYTMTDEGLDYRIGSAVTQSIEVVGRRVNELGTTEPIIQRQGSDRILVQVPGLQDPQRLKDILGQTAKLTFQMVDQTMPVEEALNGRPPAGSVVMYSQDDPPVPYLIEERVIVSGENLVDAQATFDQRTNEPSSRSASTPRAPHASARRRSRMSAACSPSSSTTRSSPRRRSASRSSAAPARFPATSRFRKRPTTSPCCCAPARCRPSWWWWRSAPSARASAPDLDRGRQGRQHHRARCWSSPS